ncbi:hypothetical protein [Streptomyces gilvus]|uniref:hypothetical protein n=1 Tax=Streptomyces gilvus TaxID=2920937 RepID=UPI001F0DF4F8|nr:hypothetical protein [Streptomyces sp. CME 23]MCH5674531.1 hypothetical protein [Streptomyces sp. CME 23]
MRVGAALSGSRPGRRPCGRRMARRLGRLRVLLLLSGCLLLAVLVLPLWRTLPQQPSS